MLISYKNRFLFIHVGKAAGSSVLNAFQPYAEPKTGNRFRRRMVWLGQLNRLGGLYRHLEFGQHVDACTVQRCLPPDVYNTLFKFAFVRNPWDRLASRYDYLRKNPKHHRHQLICSMDGFEEYVDYEMRRGKMFQYTQLTDASGRMIVDFVGYYEQLSDDFAKVCNRLGVQASLPHLNKSVDRDYRTYFTPELRTKVARYFSRDIEMFGYTFEGLRAAP